MKQRVCTLALALLSLALIACSAAAPKPPAGLKVLDSSATTKFPASVIFNLSAESDASINQVRLHYTVEQESYAQVTSEVKLELVPNTRINTQWSWDMRKTGGLPPGASLEYWWTVQDTTGKRVQTTPLKVQLDDNRYSWKSLTKGKLTLYWYQGEQSFADALMSAAEQAMARLSEETGAYLKKPVKIYIYASTSDLQGAMVFPQEWSGGVTYTRYGIIAIGIAPANLDWGKRAIVHELTHVIVHQMTVNPYSELPTWLNEGLAMYSEGALETEYVRYLEKAIAGNSLLSVRSLASPFSSYADESLLAYAQSFSLVEFLVKTRGQDKMLELLNTFSQGSGYDEALEKVYGFNADGLDALWRDYVIQRYQKVPASKVVA